VLLRVAAFCSVLQCVAVCCSLLQDDLGCSSDPFVTNLIRYVTNLILQAGAQCLHVLVMCVTNLI